MTPNGLTRRDVVKTAAVVGGALALTGPLPGPAHAAPAGAPIAAEDKFVRTITYFTDSPSERTTQRLADLSGRLEGRGYTIQTTRVVSKGKDIGALTDTLGDSGAALSVGTLSLGSAKRQLREFFAAGNTNFNVDLTRADIGPAHVDFFLRVAAEQPSHTFNFNYVFNNPGSTPFFPAANYERRGFAVGLQPTNLARTAASLQDWLNAVRSCWREIDHEFRRDDDFLGIDGSIAPFSTGPSSLVNFVKRLGYTFERSTTSTVYVTTTEFLRTQNPRAIGLNGLMLPCLEDGELTAEYDAGRFPVERNIFLSLHSGLGIDTYPVGLDEDPARMLEVLRLTQALSNKHRKALSVRFASDGRARIGDRTDFRSEYLNDCTIRPL